MSVNEEVKQRIMRLVECPVCFDIYEGSISMCRTGHSICKNCSKNLRLCPICKSSYSDRNNVILEKFTSHLYENQDQNLIMTCPAKTISNRICCWKGDAVEFKSHITKFHTIIEVSSEGSLCKIPLRISSMSRDICCKFIKAFTDIFALMYGHDDKYFYCVMYYARPVAKSAIFKYTVKINSVDMKGLVKFTLIMHSIVKFSKFMENPNCFRISRSILRKFELRYGSNFEVAVAKL